jgi:hypothetical protein
VAIISPRNCSSPSAAALIAPQSSTQWDKRHERNVPGVAFVPTDLKLHHGCCLMHWNMVDGGGAVISPGVSYLQFGADGRLIQMNGFFDLNASEVKE